MVKTIFTIRPGSALWQRHAAVGDRSFCLDGPLCSSVTGERDGLRDYKDRFRRSVARGFAGFGRRSARTRGLDPRGRRQTASRETRRIRVITPSWRGR
jgi:hypothetical protein